MVRIAKGYASLAIKIYEHVEYYKPETWRETLHQVMSCPYFTPKDAEILLKSHNEKKIGRGIEIIASERPKWDTLNKYPVVKDAIRDFFEKNPDIESKIYWN